MSNVLDLFSVGWIFGEIFMFLYFCARTFKRIIWPDFCFCIFIAFKLFLKGLESTLRYCADHLLNHKHLLQIMAHVFKYITLLNLKLQNLFLLSQELHETA